MDTLSLQALDDFLMSERAPANSMQLSDLDGFLTGLAVVPRSISPIELLPVVWGDDEPAFADDDEAEWVIDTILARYDEIVETLARAPHAFTPVFWAGPDGEAIVDDWAAGFLDAVGLCADDWHALFADDDGFLAIVPIVIAGQDPQSLTDMGVNAETKTWAHLELPKVLTACLARMRDFFAEQARAHDNDNPAPTTH